MRQITAPRRPAAPPRDPAPSRLGYRYQRLMLTPGFRVFVRVGVPLILIAVLAGSWFSKPENRAMLEDRIAQARQSFQERPQFMVQSLALTGGDDALQAQVQDLLQIAFPVSSFDLDLEMLRQQIEALDPVKSASVRVGQGGALEIAVSPRVPVALWRDGQTLRLIDDAGVQAGTVAARGDRLDLPLIAGDGAEQNIAEALALYASVGPLRDRVRGFVRIGQRRWDVILDREQRIMLPAQDAAAAFDRVIALNAAQDMLERDVTIVDMRNVSRPTLRMNQDAAAAMRRVNDTRTTNGAEN